MKQYGRKPKPRVRNGMAQGEKVTIQDARAAMDDMKGLNTNQRRHAHQKKFGC